MAVKVTTNETIELVEKTELVEVIKVVEVVKKSKTFTIDFTTEQAIYLYLILGRANGSITSSLYYELNKYLKLSDYPSTLELVRNNYIDVYGYETKFDSVIKKLVETVNERND